MTRVLLLIALLTGAAGCAGNTPTGRRPARIGHMVFIKLNDPAERAALIEDCDAMLSTIKGVTAYSAGRRLDVGRETMEYDVGLYIGFETEADYAAYVEDEAHRGLVEAWKPRMAWLRVYDLLDETP